MHEAVSASEAATAAGDGAAAAASGSVPLITPLDTKPAIGMVKTVWGGALMMYLTPT